MHQACLTSLSNILYGEIVMSYYLLAKIMSTHPNRKINGQYRRLYYRGHMPHKV